MKYLLKNVNMISMTSEYIAYGVDILISNGKIEKIGTNIDCDCVEIDLSGKYIIPGLFDCHVHIDTKDMCGLFIANGITSVRNMDGSEGHIQLSKDILSDKIVGPYVYSSSPIYDGPEGENGHKVINSEDDIKKAIENIKNNGFMWFKNYPLIEPEIMKHLLEETKKVGITVCGHGSKKIDYKTLADYGYNCIEHTSSLPSSHDDIEYMAKSGMWFCPTHVVCETLPDYVWDGKRLEDVENYKYVIPFMKDLWHKKNEKIIAGYKELCIKPDINIIIERGKCFMKYSNNILAGSDSAYPGIVAGFSLHDELQRLASTYGMGNFGALKAATTNAARYMGLEKQKGTITVGFDADLVALDKNPLEDISNTKTINTVIQGGKIYSKEEINKILNELINYPPNECDCISKTSWLLRE